jgi:hypothetical protein
MLRSSCVPACPAPGVIEPCLPSLRASRRGVPVFEVLRQRRNEPRMFLHSFDLSQLNVRDAQRRAREAHSRRRLGCAIEPAPRRAERLNRACSSMPASAAWRKRRRSRYESGRTDHWLKVTNRPLAAARREAKEDCSPRTRGLASLFPFTSPYAASPSSLWGLS